MATASDDFNRADGAIGGNWTQVSGTWTVATNAANQTSAGGVYNTALYTATPPATNDYSVTAQVRNDGSSFGVGVIARGASGAVSGYAVIGFGGDSFYLIRLDSGSDTILATMSAMATGTTYTVEVEVSGTTVRGRIDGGAWSSVTDANYASGGWGLACYGSAAGGGRWMDTFAAADLAGATVRRMLLMGVG